MRVARDELENGRLPRAERAYRAVLRQVPEEARHERIVGVQVRSLIGLALTEFESRGDLASALRRLDQAHETIERTAAEGLLAGVHGQRALMLLRVGEVPRALEALDQAASHLASAELHDQMAVLLNRGNVLLEQGQLAASADDFERVVALAYQAGDRTREARAQHNLGYVHFLLGSIPKALAMMEQAEQISPADEHPIGLLDRARVLREAGLVRDADVLLDRAARKLAEGKLFQDLGETELVRAECALLDGDPRTAKTLAGSALRRFRRRGNARWERNAELLALRCERRLAELRPGGPPKAALRALASRASELAQRCEREGRDDLVGPARLLAAEAGLRAGNRYIDKTILHAPIRSGDPVLHRLQAREVRALAALAEGDTRRAREQVRRGLAELGSYQNRFGSLDLRTASAIHGGSLAKLHLQMALQTARPSTVFNAIEAARAVSTRLPLVRPPSDARTAELLAHLRQVQEEIRLLAGDLAARDESTMLNTRARALRSAIRARAWEIEGEAGQLEASATFARVRAAAPDSAFVSYAQHRGRWVAVCGRGRTSTLCDLVEVSVVDELVQRVRADLDALALPHLARQIAFAISRSLTKSLQRLDDLLLAPLHIHDVPVTISASGSLGVLPWTLLGSRAEMPTVVTPSATSWLRHLDHPRPRRPQVIAIAGPALAQAEAEAERVKSVWTSGRLLSKDSATVAAAHRALQEANVVHFAAHGNHRQDSPLFSSLLLADGELYAYELDSATKIAGFVALSACEGSLATVRPGDEGLGLTNVLLQLGVSSVIGSVARVRDELAASVMSSVHHEMSRGVDSATALTRAQWQHRDSDVPVAFQSFGARW